MGVVVAVLNRRAVDQDLLKVLNVYELANIRLICKFVTAETVLPADLVKIVGTNAICVGCCWNRCAI